MGGAHKFSEFFKFDWRSQKWNLMVLVGAVLGGFIAYFYLSNPIDINLNLTTVNQLEALGFTNVGKSLLPAELFEWNQVLSLKGLAILIIGGFLVGFGTRYAGGCTSGHAITGLSSLQWISMVAVIGFFLGGLVMIHFIFPFIF